MLCAAAAGDSATAKAVFLASEVRKMDHLRTIGGQSSFARLGDDALPSHGEQQGGEENSEWNNEYDNHALATIDGQIDDGNNAGGVIITYGEREYGKDTRAISALLHSCAKAMNSNGVGTIWAGTQNQGYLCENSLRLITTRWEPSYTDKSIPGENSTEIGLSQLRRYDENLRDDEPQPGKRKKFRGLYIDDDAVLTTDDIDNYDQDDEVSDFLEPRSVAGGGMTQKHDVEKLNTEAELKEKTFGVIEDDTIQENMELTPGETLGDLFEDDLRDSGAFEAFYAELKEEVIKDGGSPDHISGEEARELFEMMHAEFSNLSDDELERALMNNAELGDDAFIQPSEIEGGKMEEVDNNTVSQEEIAVASNYEIPDIDDEDATKSIEGLGPTSVALHESVDRVSLDPRLQITQLEGVSEDDKLKLLDLQEALPGMPIYRLRRVLKAYQSTLSYPSLLTLVPILRETMPDHISLGYLRRINTATADFAFQRAEEDRAVNKELLNSMLLVKTNSGSLSDALAFHSEMYRKHRVVSASCWSCYFAFVACLILLRIHNISLKIETNSV